jgi:DNA-binding SARP family transcriptional activator/predicted ATPase
MPRLAVHLLGPLTVELGGQPVTFSYEKVRALLAYLCAEADHPHPRTRLTALLWPDQPQSAAQGSLRQAISHLRKTLNDKDSTTPFLIVERDVVRLNLESDIFCDLHHFRSAVLSASGHRHRNIHTCQECAASLRYAAGLVRGNFLEDVYVPDSDLFENWLTAAREQVRIQTLKMLEHLAKFYRQVADIDRVIQYANQQIHIDPYNEQAHQHMMWALDLSGQRSQAVLHFERLKTLLAEELGISPAPETLHLLDRIKSGEAVAHASNRALGSLPAPLMPLVGRAVELSELCVWLTDPARRLISVVGVGGSGKTRLVLEALHKVTVLFPDGIVYISPRENDSGESLLNALCSALKLSAASISNTWEQVNHYLQGREMLLVLDEFEHDLSDKGNVSNLLENNAGLVILVTSRERLNLPGEWVFGLGGLDVPPPYLHSRLNSYSSVVLFCQCAQQANQAFELNADNQDDIREICRLVGGLPLAIRLAASWVNSLTCRDIALEISHNLDILSDRQGKAGDSMRAVFEQSWQMLSVEERAVLARLSAFHNGFDRAAAEDVAGASVEQLSNLVDKSLLRFTPEGRYDLHDLIIQFGAEKLDEMEEADLTRRRHFEYYYRMAEENETLLTKEGNLTAFLWLVRESTNLHAALAWSISPNGETVLGDAGISQRFARYIHPDLHHMGLHMFDMKREPPE